MFSKTKVLTVIAGIFLILSLACDMQLENETETLAVKAIKSMEDALLSEGSGILTSELMDIVGIETNTDNSDKYFQKVSRDLQKMQDEIGDKIDELHEELSNGIHNVETGLTDIKIAIEDSNLQNSLREYDIQKRIILEKFSSFSNIIKNLNVRKPKNNGAILKELYTLLQLNNIDNVSISMSIIHDLFCGDGQLRGLVEYETQVFKNDTREWAKNSSNFIKKIPINANYKGHYNYDTISPYRDNSMVLTDVFTDRGPKTIEEKVLPLFKSVLNVQLQGLILLRAAWENTYQSSKLDTHVSEISQMVKDMKEFFPNLIQNQDVENWILKQIEEYSAKLPDRFYEEATNENNELRIVPRNEDWIIWGSPYNPPTSRSEIPIILRPTSFNKNIIIKYIFWEDGYFSDGNWAMANWNEKKVMLQAPVTYAQMPVILSEFLDKLKDLSY